MFGWRWRRYVRLLEEVDGLCFEQKAGIKLVLWGKPAYENEAKIPGDQVGREWYIVPIFCNYSDSNILRFVMHEVRHRIQWNYPVSLLTIEDAPAELQDELAAELQDIKSPREIDAKIIEYLAFSYSFSSELKLKSFLLGRNQTQGELEGSFQIT